VKNPGNKRILVIEDDEHIAEGLRLNLRLQGYDVKLALNGVSGLQLWKEWRPNLIVLDIMLPGIDGFSLLQNIRLEDERIPVLILSAKGSSEDKVKGFSYGSDDYLSKPFHLEEFLLRVDRLLTRLSWSHGDGDFGPEGRSSFSQIFTLGNNRVDFGTSIAHCKQGRVRLTEQEVKLLKLFISNRGKPLSRRTLLEIGWGYTGSITTRTVDNFVGFRKYFEDNPKKPIYFKSIRSVGYVFNDDSGESTFHKKDGSSPKEL
jgi:DNA-binding response OmpR family regulator